MRCKDWWKDQHKILDCCGGGGDPSNQGCTGYLAWNSKHKYVKGLAYKIVHSLSSRDIPRSTDQTTLISRFHFFLNSVSPIAAGFYILVISAVDIVVTMHWITFFLIFLLLVYFKAGCAVLPAFSKVDQRAGHSSFSWKRFKIYCTTVYHKLRNFQRKCFFVRVSLS